MNPNNYKRVVRHKKVENKGGYYETTTTLVRKKPKVGRNEPCSCGSGEKFKKCCTNQTNRDY